jgi:hypothetical protein
MVTVQRAIQPNWLLAQFDAGLAAGSPQRGDLVPLGQSLLQEM